MEALVCPNPECRHRVRTGKPAEYAAGRETCADCGSALVAASSLARPAPAPPAPAALWARLGVVLGVPVAIEVLMRVVLPGIERSELPDELRGAPELGILALGIVPYLTAAALVELVAALVPGWRPLRVSGPAGRARLHRATLALTLAFATVQAWSVATYAEAAFAETMVSVAPWFRWLAVPTLVAGTFLLLSAARFVERRGLGAGVSVLLAGGAVAIFADHLWFLGRGVAIGELTPLGLLAGHAGVVLAVVATWWVLRRHRPVRPSEQGPAIAIRVPASGLSPLEVGASASGLLAMGELTGSWLVPALVTVAATPIFALLWNRTGLVAEVLARAAGGPVPREPLAQAAAAARARALRATVPWVIAIAVVPPFLDESTGIASAALVSSAVVLTAIVMDLAAEWRARRRDPSLVPVWPIHRVYEIDAAVAILAERGIEAHPRAAHHRTLLQFFGPFVPVDLLVPEPRAAEALTLLEARLLGTPPDRPPPA